jgi:hypothetical protein
MNVNSTGSMDQMQMQMRKMDGSGGGQGQGGMKDIMQSLSSEDQATLQEELGSMTQTERMDAISQMKSVDKTSMSDQEYTQSLLDILNQEDETQASTTNILSVYA